MTADDRPASAAPLNLTRRDLTVDLARVGCVLLVVLIHVLMVGVGRTADGSLITSRPLEEQPWFAAATWVGQIMPLFFVVGGFASATAWASARARGQDAGDYVRGRLLRLGRPAAGVFVFLAIALAVASVVGVDPELLATVAVGIGSPLWFLAAYGIVQVCVPFMVRLHARRPRTTFVVLVSGALAVDLVRHATGVQNVGLVNLLFVWVFVQQLGFLYADGALDRVRPVVLAVIAAGSYLLLVPLTMLGSWSPDMLNDLNPPTVPLMLLGVAQLCLLRLLRPALARVMKTRPARAIVFAVGSRGMTVYLWHLPLVILLTGALLVFGAPLPTPGTPTWWLSRIPMYLAVLALAFAVSLAVGRLERPPRSLPADRRRPALAAIAVAAVLLIGPAFLIMIDGLDLPLAIAGAVATPIALIVLGRTRPRPPAAMRHAVLATEQRR